ncbi:hypothetical protein EV188_104682 [Actinomycetospora succinea]|uniref:Uncharacterized protein n=1 Tax=Actinomycetospora succinea TaxID=663603 RepID=A0A4R6VB68_9PSEU|nr:hypothetical protein [Actinomycetospora succinea]TDQ58933.1 hypothetical protein EV188_104682 [Actinomycetospora succinea]
MDFSAVICPETGVTAREAAVRALVARDHLGGEVTALPELGLRERRAAMIEDVRVLTGLLAAELSCGGDPTPGFDAPHQAGETHRATLLSDDFAFQAALAMRALDRAEQSE